MRTNGNTLLARFSVQEFASLGLSDVAYVRPKQVDGGRVFAIHAADGKEIATFEDWEIAVATVRLNDLEPVFVH